MDIPMKTTSRCRLFGHKWSRFQFDYTPHQKLKFVPREDITGSMLAYPCERNCNALLFPKGVFYKVSSPHSPYVRSF